MNCKNCGNPLVPGANVCSVCGTGVINNDFSVLPTGNIQSSMGQPAPVQAPTSQPSMGQTMPGQVPMSQPPMGQPTPVQAPTSQLPMGQPTSVQAPTSQLPMGHPIPGQTLEGQPQTHGQLTADNKGKSKKGLIVIILLALFAIAIGGVVIVSSNQDQNETNKSEKKKDEGKEEKEEKIDSAESLKKLVTIKNEIKLADGGLLFVVSNTSSKTLALSLEVEFYDASDLILGTSDDIVTLAPNSDGYLYFNEYAVKEGYAKYATNMIIEDFTDIQKVVNIPESELIKNETEDELVVQYKNTATDTIDYINLVVLFYSNNQIVSYDDTSKFDVQAGSNANFTIYTNLIKDDVAYDRYEIYASATTNIYSD